jgi:hypothetical protein
MDYSLAISPDLRINAEEFATVWNQDPTCKDIAKAKLAEANAGKYIFLDPELIRQGLVFLAGVASTVALDVFKDVIKDRIQKILAGRADSNATPPIEVLIIQSGENPVIVVKAKV